MRTTTVNRSFWIALLTALVLLTSSAAGLAAATSDGGTLDAITSGGSKPPADKDSYDKSKQDNETKDEDQDDEQDDEEDKEPEKAPVNKTADEPSKGAKPDAQDRGDPCSDALAKGDEASGTVTGVVDDTVGTATEPLTLDDVSISVGAKADTSGGKANAGAVLDARVTSNGAASAAACAADAAAQQAQDALAAADETSDNAVDAAQDAAQDGKETKSGVIDRLSSGISTISERVGNGFQKFFSLFG